METRQLSLDFTGAELRDAGIEKALESANGRTENWSSIAYDFLLKYIRNNKEFMTEELRAAAEGIVPDPPSLRAWGGVIVRAVKNNLIKRNGFKNVKNPKAHCTPATVWKVITGYKIIC